MAGGMQGGIPWIPRHGGGCGTGVRHLRQRRHHSFKAERLGLPLNVIPPAGDVSDVSNIAASAAASASTLARAGAAATVCAHAGAAPKRAASTSLAPPRTKAMRFHPSAGAVNTAAATVAAAAKASVGAPAKASKRAGGGIRGPHHSGASKSRGWAMRVDSMIARENACGVCNQRLKRL
jgi:hypothetical protein